MEVLIPLGCLLSLWIVVIWGFREGAALATVPLLLDAGRPSPTRYLLSDVSVSAATGTSEVSGRGAGLLIRPMLGVMWILPLQNRAL